MAGISLVMALDISSSAGRPHFYAALAFLPAIGIYSMAWPLGWKGTRMVKAAGYFTAALLGVSGWIVFILMLQLN